MLILTINIDNYYYPYVVLNITSARLTTDRRSGRACSATPLKSYGRVPCYGQFSN